MAADKDPYSSFKSDRWRCLSLLFRDLRLIVIALASSAAAGGFVHWLLTRGA